MKDKGHALEEQPDGTIIPVETTGNKSASVMGYVPELICTVCLEAYEGEEGLSFCCDECGRGGFCKDCAEPQEHDCE